MKYNVILTKEAIEKFNELELTAQDKLYSDYHTIETIDINAVHVKSLGNKLFEIKTDNLRSIFEYSKGQIIIIALIFTKKSQKTPPKYLKLARNILNNFEKE